MDWVMNLRLLLTRGHRPVENMEINQIGAQPCTYFQIQITKCERKGKLERYSLAFVTTSLPMGRTGMNQAFFALLHCMMNEMKGVSLGLFEMINEPDD